MFEWIVSYAAQTLPTVILSFPGLVAARYGLANFGTTFTFRLWKAMLLLWFFDSMSGLMFGKDAFDELGYFSIVIFTFGAFFFLVSLVFRHFQRRALEEKKKIAALKEV